jgi:signal transduction histidine kinase
MLHEFIVMNREKIIRRCRTKVATRSVPSPTDTELDHGVPVFLDQLADALRRHLISSPDIARSAVEHGHELLLQGFTVSQVVHDYGDVCQAITELAVEMNEPISTDDFRMLNRCLDDAIAGAVTEFGRQQNESTLNGETARGNERAGFLAHEMRNLLNTAIIAFEVLKTGNVGVGGSTGTVLHRSLMGARALTGRSLAEVRLTQGVQNPGAGTTVVLRVGASAERVLIEIQDECGGLPIGNVNELFRPFEQRGGDRTGLGLGLAFSRWGVEANNGRIYARSLPETGCVFTVDLPRVPVPAMAIV